MEIAKSNSISKEEESSFNSEIPRSNNGRKRKLSTITTTLVSSPVLSSSILFSSSHTSPSSRSKYISSSQQEQQLSPICTLSELLRSEYDPTSSSSSYKTYYDNNVDDDCSNSNKPSTASTISKKQRQQHYYQQQKQEQQVTESNHYHNDLLLSSSNSIAIVSPLSSPKDEQHNKKRVHFSMTEPQLIQPSAYSNDINTDPGYLKQQCWYTQKEYVTFFQDRQDTVKLWYKAKNLDLIHEFIARSNEYCLRGLESYYQSITSNDAKRRHRSTHRYYVFLHQQLLKHTTNTTSCTRNHIHSTSCLPSSTPRSDSGSMTSEQLHDDCYDSNSSDTSVTDTLTKQNRHVQDVVERMSSYSMSRAQILAEWDEQDAMFIHYFNIPTVATGTPEIQNKIDNLYLYDQENSNMKNSTTVTDTKRMQHERRNSIMNNVRFQDRMNRTRNNHTDDCCSSSTRCTKQQEQNHDQYELKDEGNQKMQFRHEQLQSFVTMAATEEVLATTNCRRRRHHRRQSHHHYRHPKSTVFPPKLYQVCDDVSTESSTQARAFSCKPSLQYNSEPCASLRDDIIVNDDSDNKKQSVSNNNINDNEYNFVQMYSKNNSKHKKETRRKHRLLPSDSIMNIPVLLSLVTKTTTPIHTVQATAKATAQTVTYFDDVATMNHLEIVEV